LFFTLKTDQERESEHQDDLRAALWNPFEKAIAQFGFPR
jgi:hypothetical protein